MAFTELVSVAAEVAQGPTLLGMDWNPAPAAPTGLDTWGTTFIAWAKWFAIVACVIGAFACGGMMAIGRRNRSDLAVQGASGVPWVIAAAILIAIAAGLITTIAGAGGGTPA